VEIALDADAPSEIVDAVRLAAARAGLEPATDAATDRGAWWQEGVAEAVDRSASAVGETFAYEAVRSPRSTRGATRA
jgi:hypothetical protein